MLWLQVLIAINYLWNALHSPLTSVSTRDALKFIKRRHRTRISFADVHEDFSALTDSSPIRDDSLTISEITVIQRKFIVRLRDPRKKQIVCDRLLFLRKYAPLHLTSLIPLIFNVEKIRDCVFLFVGKITNSSKKKEVQNDHIRSSNYIWFCIWCIFLISNSRRLRVRIIV